MIKYFFRIVITLILGIVLIGCCEKGDEPKTTTACRTVIVYMLADNNLGSIYHFDNKNIESMINAISNNNIDGRLLIFYAGDNKRPGLYELIKDKNNVVKDTLLIDYTGQVSTDSATMRQVITDAQRIAPAESYGVIFWSHATGWLPQNRFYAPHKTSNPQSFGREGYEECTIDIDEMGNALDPFHFDFILFDACLMASVEVAYELKSVCDYIIASPTETMGAGYPYEEIIPLMFEHNIDYNAICEEYTQKYIEPTDWDGTISLIKTSSLEQLADACRNIIMNNELTAYNYNNIQYYDRREPHVFFDLVHFMSQIANDEQLEQLNNAINEAIPYKANDASFLSIIIKHYCGLSCYIPGSADDETEEYYSKLKWYNRVYQ